MTTDDLRARAREAAEGRYAKVDQEQFRLAFIAGFLAHAAQQPVIHLCDPSTGSSYCGEPITLVGANDYRPVCQECHRGAMKAVRSRWCPCASNRPQDCKPENWPLSARHGLHAAQQPTRGQIARAIYDALGGDHALYRDVTGAVLALLDEGQS